MDTQHQQLIELKRTMKETKELRLFECYQSIYFYLSGYTMEEFAGMAGHNREIMADTSLRIARKG